MHLCSFQALFNRFLVHAGLLAFLFNLAPPLLFLPCLLFSDHLFGVVFADTLESHLNGMGKIGVRATVPHGCAPRDSIWTHLADDHVFAPRVRYEEFPKSSATRGKTVR